MQVDTDGVVEFIPFDSAAGQQLLQKHITQLIADLADADLAQDPAGVRHKANDLTRAYHAYQVQGFLS